MVPNLVPNFSLWIKNKKMSEKTPCECLLPFSSPPSSPFSRSRLPNCRQRSCWINICFWQMVYKKKRLCGSLQRGGKDYRIYGTNRHNLIFLCNGEYSCHFIYLLITLPTPACMHLICICIACRRQYALFPTQLHTRYVVEHLGREIPGQYALLARRIAPNLAQYLRSRRIESTVFHQ